MKLSAKQQEIVESTHKYCYVVAGAGSGKTRTLMERIKWLLGSSKPGEKILALTFSNKAADELKGRLQSNPGDDLNEKVYVGTIHNFCMELVLQRGATIGLSPNLHIFDSESDRLEVFTDALTSIPQMQSRYRNPDGSLDSKHVKDTFNAFSNVKRNLRFPTDYESKPLSQLLYQEYNSRMLAQDAIDFDDILLYAYRILAEKEAVASIYQRVYKHICIDEAQDLNRAQYEVVKALAGSSSSIFMVGDPHQAIYGFNGSSSAYMMQEFPKDYPDAYKYELLENYRSSRSVVNAAQLIEPSDAMTSQLPIQGEFSCLPFANEKGEAEWVIAKYRELLTNGHPDVEDGIVRPEQCAVLARNKYVFRELESLLNESQIDYHLRASALNGLSSESTLFKVFNLSLRLLMNSKDIIHLSEFKALIGIDLSSDYRFGDLQQMAEIDAAVGTAGATVLRSAWSTLGQPGDVRMKDILDGFETFCGNESNFQNDEERLLVTSDYEDWSSLWKDYCKSSSVGERDLAAMMRSIALGIAGATKDEHGLTLSTVHMSKGLEFDAVFVMGLTEGTFPDYRATDEDGLSEERHNMFVAITRSKCLCYLTYPLEKMMPWGSSRTQNPSQFLSAWINE
jgi:DNA helicase-2/ATP-dependent DNA helicase PcrA